jgi:membrane-bound lytic murein transglycosylase B
LPPRPQWRRAPACGGDLGAFLEGVKAEAVAKGVSPDVARQALRNASIDRKVLSRDRAQGVFRQTFLEFSKRSVSANRMQVGAKKMKQYAKTFARAEAEYRRARPRHHRLLGSGDRFRRGSGRFQHHERAGDAGP